MPFKEGVAQGGPIAIIAYGIVILPPINNLKRQIPDVTQTWYADDTGALCTFVIIDTCYYSLTRQVPGSGYYPEPSKSLVIVHPDNLEAGKYFGARHGFKMYTEAHYLGGYIGYNKSKSDWLRERTLTWDKKINTISKTVGKYPQESYATVIRAIQSEWIFLQRVTWDTGDAFAVVEKMIRGKLFASSFLWKDENHLTHSRSSK